MPSGAIASGLRDVVWPGRFQQIHPRVTLDGAHNPAAAARLAQTWRENHGERRATVILGLLKDKDMRGICEALLPIIGRILTVPVVSQRTATPQEICREFGQVAPRQECMAIRDLPAAIRIALGMERPILITGSLFLVGEALAYFEKSGPPEASAQ
jgi:dihydrofolate synthase/folylpolyglutamate synthase